MRDLSDLITFKALEASSPLKGKALRQVVKDLGYKPAPGRREMVFGPDDVTRISDAIRCSSVSTPPPPARATGSGSYAAHCPATARACSARASDRTNVRQGGRE